MTEGRTPCVRRAPAQAPLLAIAVAALGCSAIEPSLGAPVGEVAPADAGDAAGAPVSFRNQIRPLMNRSSTDPGGHGCKACHYPAEASHVGFDQTGLDLSTLGSLRRGGSTTGSDIVIPGNADDSKLYQKLEGTYPSGARMPRDGPAYWSAEDIGLVERWIHDGARGDDDE